MLELAYLSVEAAVVAVYADDDSIVLNPNQL